ncbi:MFS transporter [Arthrobacter sp. zg-Y179]|uniref:MFS transporter n=1 Tax=Arthrobacter sp. zg-Y179 TaxID=2894188 RepID=UPI001E531092|nr:MFS transporter [Arthrobacter sp. zg-Y179]MCC9174824.1 MFS transporter [Arthrobacter sp. zg-Y179]
MSALWTIQALLAIVGSASSLAVSLVLFENSASAAVLAVSTFLGAAAAIYLAPLIGGLTDLFSRRAAICTVNTANAAAMAAMAWATVIHSTALMLVFVFVTAICSTALALTLQASVRVLRTEKDLTKVNGMLGLIDSAPVLLGPLLGAVLYSLGIPVAVFLADAVLSVAGAALVLLLVWPVEEPRARKVQYFGGNVKAGFRFINERRDLLRLQIAFAVYNFAGGLCVPVVIVFILSFPGTGTPEWNLSASNIASALGLMSGAALVARFGSSVSRANLVCGSTFLGSLFGRALVVAAPSLWLVIPGMFLRNAMVQATNAPLSALWQERTPVQIQGIVFGCRRLLGQGLFPVAVLLGGVLVDALATLDGMDQLSAAKAVLIIGGALEIACIAYIRFSRTSNVFEPLDAPQPTAA